MAELFKVSNQDLVKDHAQLYFETDGKIGHHADFSDVGGPADSPCLVLKTKGRKSGKWNIAPVIYGEDGDNYVVIASLGGAPNHPSWYLNIEADPDNVLVQVKDRKFRAKARVAKSPERERLWRMMAKVYFPFDEYQARTSRVIPLVVLEPQAELEKL